MTHTRDRDNLRHRLKQAAPIINPSLLACDFARLAEEIEVAASCGTPVVHWDVMDGHFVPNFTYGPPVIASLRPTTNVIFDTHLMMASPGKYLNDFLQAGCDVVTIHVEAVPDQAELTGLLQQVQRAGALAGVTLNPTTPVERLEPLLTLADLVLIMSVTPGFGGQSFDPAALQKLTWVREHAPADLLLEIDGGINRNTIRDAYHAGAEVLVVGSAFYGTHDRSAAYGDLRRVLMDQ